MRKKKEKSKAFDYDCIVVGGGPGGLVSALYLSRFKRKVLLVDAGHSRAQWIPRMRNLVGYGAGIQGLTLLKNLKAQLNRYPSDLVQGEAEVSRLAGGGFRIQVDEISFTAQTVILATGMKDQQPPLPNIPQLRKMGLLAYCPICDGYEHSDKKIGIFVKDSKGLQKGKFLKQFTENIFIFQVRPFRLSPFDRKFLKKNHLRIFEGEIVKLRPSRRPKGLWVQMKNQDPVLVDSAYVAMGVDFNLKTTRKLKGLRRTKDGHIVTRSHQETSIPGLYAVGDCVNALAQVSVAVGQAALAATRIHNRLGS